MNELMQKMQQLDTLKNEVSFLRKSADAKFISLTVSDCSGLTVTPFGSYDSANLFTELFDCKENEDLLREYISKVAERADVRRQELQAEVAAQMIEDAVVMKQNLSPLSTSVPSEAAPWNAKASFPRITIPKCTSVTAATALSFREIRNRVESVQGKDVAETILKKYSDTGKLTDVPAHLWPDLWKDCGKHLPKTIKPGDPQPCVVGRKTEKPTAFAAPYGEEKRTDVDQEDL